MTILDYAQSLHAATTVPGLSGYLDLSEQQFVESIHVLAAQLGLSTAQPLSDAQQGLFKINILLLYISLIV